MIDRRLAHAAGMHQEQRLGGAAGMAAFAIKQDGEARIGGLLPQHVAPGVPQARAPCHLRRRNGGDPPVRRSTPRPSRQALPLIELR
jgi:hypothetical protein